eukprot:CAMPEP_0197691060 /NCGR_PEP_ID=MMETSP1338-20131121/109197_1 /TAXON_ID=43686 ORGANISM="Pelagodinium beii, Strain RCC1491" /NCGR_SAMPLE_ID=MMETSP1338 /ASSEMBLY_ACC=CAM_ASM_000754 /LENGTH=52 /DNA_ID=CAMNT_0043273569 /DNA_START=10 /DNA_END=165 /DNA_ORIENTATION=-
MNPARAIISMRPPNHVERNHVASDSQISKHRTDINCALVLARVPSLVEVLLL